MSRLQPFAYSASPHQRKHGPGGYKNYNEYKDWLRDEFVFRCVYCLERELWYPSRHAAFGVEHVLPRASHPDLECEYDNLVFACSRCNSFKRETITLDPTTIAFADHLRIERDGRMTPLTAEGEMYILLFHLNKPPAIENRRGKLLILRLKQDLPENPKVEELYQSTFGFPDELPDLEAKRPESNSRPDGVRDCYFRQRSDGRLGRVY
jgi:hypothetical protein